MRYSGKIGFSRPTEVAPGVWEEVITERTVHGDVVQRTEVLGGSDSVIPEYKTTTSISVLSNGPGKLNYSDIRYVTYAGLYWTISSTVVQPPRMVMYIGEEYHGPTPGTT